MQLLLTSHPPTVGCFLLNPTEPLSNPATVAPKQHSSNPSEEEVLDSKTPDHWAGCMGLLSPAPLITQDHCQQV